mgnify:CR=1 FL=1
MAYIAIFLISVFISSISQILLKKSANKSYDNKLREYLNLRVIIAYGMFFLSSLITVYAYKFVPLSMGGILESSGYIFVTVLGYFILHEKVSRKKLAGLVIILAGILIFNI